MSYLVGLTGGIGSGKSTVAALFSELGVPVIDTDAISHQLTQCGGLAIPAIRDAFGEAYIAATGALDRVKMRELVFSGKQERVFSERHERVFSDASAKHQLEKILHPLILAQAKSQAAASPAPYVMLVIPLLFETNNYQDWLNQTLTVDCSEQTQLARATRRSGLDAQTVRAIMAQQLSRSERLKRADNAIQNDGGLIEIRQQIAQLHQRYMNLATRSN